MDQVWLIFFNQTLADPMLDKVMVAITYGGLFLLPLTAGILWLGQQRRVGLAVMVAILASLALTLIFQFLAWRPRPTEVRLIISQSLFPSYPSGHAAMAFATATVLSLAYRRPRVWLITFSVAGLIALSRVYLGLHYPTDLLGGAALGLGVGAAGYGMIAAQQSHWRWLLWPQIALAILVSQMAYLRILPDSNLLKAPADKILHFILFGTIACWLNLWLSDSPAQSKFGAVPLAVLIPFAIALVEECLQALSPVRTFDLMDLFSDLIGMLFFWWVSALVMRRKPGTIVLPPGTI